MGVVAPVVGLIARYEYSFSISLSRIAGLCPSTNKTEFGVGSSGLVVTDAGAGVVPEGPKLTAGMDVFG